LRVGMENRDGVLELPLEADWKEFLQSVETMPFAGTWFDIGHAYKKERLGLMSAQEVLDVTDRNRVGFHLHNVTANGHDHQGMLEEGIVDFSILKGRIKPGDPVVLEFSSRVSTDDVKRSLEFAKKLVSESLSTN